MQFRDKSMFFVQTAKQIRRLQNVIVLTITFLEWRYLLRQFAIFDHKMHIFSPFHAGEAAPYGFLSCKW